MCRAQRPLCPCQQLRPKLPLIDCLEEFVELFRAIDMFNQKEKKNRRAWAQPVRYGGWVGGSPGSWLCLPVEWGHQITGRTMVLHSVGSLKWAGSGGERLAEASGGLPGVRSALTEHATAEWLENMRGNEKLVATQLEPRVPFDAQSVCEQGRGDGEVTEW